MAANVFLKACTNALIKALVLELGTAPVIGKRVLQSLKYLLKSVWNSLFIQVYAPLFKGFRTPSVRFGLRIKTMLKNLLTVVTIYLWKLGQIHFTFH